MLFERFITEITMEKSTTKIECHRSLIRKRGNLSIEVETI